jgi:hypothetical protein
MKELNSSYMVLDDTLTMPVSKLWAIMVWANVDSSKYTQVYYYQRGNQLVPIPVYTTDYYKLLCVRLYNFDGKASTGEKPIVLTYTVQISSTGQSYRLASNAQQFNSYQAAQAYVAAHPNEKDAIVSNNPFVNPIPLEAVPDFKLVFSSTKNDALSVSNHTAEVKVFQYTGS